MFVKDALNYFSGGYLFKESSYTSGKMLIKDLSKHSPFKTLFKEAQNVVQKSGLGSLKVHLEAPKSGFNAEQDKSVIRIRPDMSAGKQRDSFIFELTNVIQHNKHTEIWGSAVKGVYQNPEEFARAAEFIEFNGLKHTNAVSKAINKEKGRFFRPYIENQWENLPLESMEFDRYYSSHLHDKHKEYYRKQWKYINNIQNTVTSDNQNPNTSDNQNPNTSIFNNTLKIALGISVIAIAFLKWG